MSGSVSSEHPFAGEHVALAGKPSVLSRRDVRTLIERLGGTFSELPSDSSVRVVSEDELCQFAGLPDLDTLRGQYYSARDLRGMYPVIRDDHLRYLEKWGLVRPVAGRYSFGDLHIIKQAALELGAGASLNGVLRALSSEREGQLTLDFQPARPDRSPARVVALPAKSTPEATLFPDREKQIATANYSLAAKYFLEGAELDDGEERDLDAAAAAYRRALMFDVQLVPAIVNLANIHYERDELIEAEALYEKAIRVDTECFEAYFNLGNIHHDLGRYGEAVGAYRDALAINPGYPEAHFYLAVTLEKLGRSTEARPHWKEYRTLAPDGEFVELAREFSD